LVGSTFVVDISIRVIYNIKCNLNANNLAI